MLVDSSTPLVDSRVEEASSVDSEPNPSSRSRNNEEQWVESTNLDLQEGLGSESTELTSSTLESTRGVLEYTSTEHSLTGRTPKRRKQNSQKG